MSNKRVLVLEDAPEDVMFIKEAAAPFEEWVDFYYVDSVSEASRKLETEGPFHLVIADYNLERAETSISFITKLRQIENGTDHDMTPIMVFSGEVNEDVLQEVKKSSVNSIVVKPDDIDDYKNMISYILQWWLLVNVSPLTFSEMTMTAIRKNQKRLQRLIGSRIRTKKRVLFLEDTIDDLMFIQKSVDPFVDWVEFHYAECEEEASDILENNGPFHLVIADYHLDRSETSIPFIQELRLSECDTSHDLTPVIVFSGEVDEDVFREVNRASVNSIVVKPDDIEEYMNMINHLLQWWLLVNVSPLTYSELSISEIRKNQKNLELLKPPSL